ncbi:MAG: hypothetical protein R2861_05795 [Desulfobacterales bacterium]
MTGKRAFEDVIKELDKKIDETDIAVHQPGADASIANMYDKPE